MPPCGGKLAPVSNPLCPQEMPLGCRPALAFSRILRSHLQSRLGGTVFQFRVPPTFVANGGIRKLQPDRIRLTLRSRLRPSSRFIGILNLGRPVPVYDACGHSSRHGVIHHIIRPWPFVLPAEHPDLSGGGFPEGFSCRHSNPIRYHALV